MTTEDKIWFKTDRTRSRYERSFARQFRIVLNKQFHDVADRVNEHNYNSEAIVNEVEPKDIAPTFESLYRTVGVDFARETYGEHKSRSEENIENGWNAYMTNYAKTEAGSRIVSITEETKRQILRYIRESIDEGITEGMGSNEIARLIKKVLNEKGVEINTWRSRMIARTEVVNASNAGAIAGARDLQQPMEKFWLATRDNRTRDAHMMTDGQKRDLSDRFDVDGVKMDHPGDPAGGPENCINCRCAVTFRVKRIY